MINKEGWRTTGKSLQILSGCANKAHIYYVFTYVLLFKVFGSFLMWDTRKGELKLRESVIVDSSWMEKFHTEYDLGVTPEDAAGFLGWRLLRGELVFHLESNCMVWKAVEGIAKKKKKNLSKSLPLILALRNEQTPQEEKMNNFRSRNWPQMSISQSSFFTIIFLKSPFRHSIPNHSPSPWNFNTKYILYICAHIVLPWEGHDSV